MSLRLRLFVAFGGLIGLVLIAQWLVIRDAKQQISKEFGRAALALSEQIAQVLETVESVSGNSGLLSTTVIKDRQDHTVSHQTEADEQRVSDILIRKHIIDFNQTTPGSEQQSKLPTGAILKEEIIAETWVTSDSTKAQEEALKHLGRKFKVRLDNPADATTLAVELPQGQMNIALPKEGVRLAFSNLKKAQFLGSAVIFLLALLAAALIANRESKPLTALAIAAHKIGEGERGTQVPFLGGGAEMRQAVMAFNTMSQRLEWFQKEAERNQESKHLAELGDIARGLAHTLRNPLNTLGLAIEELGAVDPGSVQSMQYVTQSRHQIRRIDQWIRSFLALASEGKGQVEALQIHELLQDIVLEVLQQDHKNVRLEYQTPHQLPAIYGVAPELRAVIHVLIINAIEASPAHGCVAINTSQTADAVVVSIADQGPGLPSHVREKLFTPHLTTKTTGSGMGLFLANRIATSRYCGTIKFQDPDQGGTLVQLNLPLRNTYDV